MARDLAHAVDMILDENDHPTVLTGERSPIVARSRTLQFIDGRAD
jgi:hypothetical protein